MCSLETAIGLRIDVDTLRGTRLGVPGLLHLLKRHGIKATFFFSVGPDNMGRHILRLLHPPFLFKMIRSRAANLYGWNIFLRGTLWPGPVIGRSCSHIIRRTVEDGHEIGLHAWDHHRWQTQVGSMSDIALLRELKKGKEELEAIAGIPIRCSAVPGWRCTDQVLQVKKNLGFQYNSDCRGHSIFYPKIKSSGKKLHQPQIPVTLPTYDELIGRKGINEKTYNDHLLSLITPDKLNILTIHAEAEGISCLQMFQDFLHKAQERNITIKPLAEMLASNTGKLCSSILRGEKEGREGWISCQDSGKDENYDE